MTTNVITSDRLILRSAHKDDLDILHRIVFSDPKVMRQAFYGQTFTKEKAAEFFHSHFDFDGSGTKAGVLSLKDTGEIIGFAGLIASTELGEQDYEIGFVLGCEYWGKGYATEIGLAQIKYGFEVVGCPRLLGMVLPENEASKAALMKLGMTHSTTIDMEGRGKREVYIISNSVDNSVE